MSNTSYKKNMTFNNEGIKLANLPSAGFKMASTESQEKNNTP